MSNVSMINGHIDNGYDEKTPCCCEPMEGEAIEPIAAISDGITICSERALEMAYKINQYFLGMGKPISQDEKFNPKCYRDILVKQRQDIIEVCVELDRLINMFGI